MFVVFVPSQIIGRVFTGVGEVNANGEVDAYEICGVIGGVVYFQAAGYDQPDEGEIADLESIELKELRSDFESGAFFLEIGTDAARARCATRPRAQHA